MKNLKLLLQTVLTIAMIIGITTALYLYTNGYRLARGAEEQVDVSKTGMVSAKSIPEGATVYLDDELRTATNDTVAGLKPGTHTIRIVKRGYVDWEKDIEIFEELVTDITAVLVSQSPRIEPLTNTGAKTPTVSPSLSKIAYFSNDSEQPGIWIIPFSGGGLNLFRLTPTIAIQDTRFTKYSFGKSIEWSPDENSLLVQGADDSYFLIDIQTNTAETATDAEVETIREDWKQITDKKRADFIEKLELDEELANYAKAEDTMWAPDEKKFLYKVLNNGNIEYRVYNMERPLPIGEKIDTLALTIPQDQPQPIISWYSDSFHLILVDGNVEQDKRGSISIIRIDGTNKTELYNNTLYSDKVYSAPGGDKVIMLTSFKSAEQTDLYTVSIR